MTSAADRDQAAPWNPSSDDASLAYAAIVVTSRLEGLSVSEAVEHIYYIADDLGVDTVELARMIVEASTGRTRHRLAAAGQSPAPRAIDGTVEFS